MLWIDIFQQDLANVIRINFCLDYQETVYSVFQQRWQCVCMVRHVQECNVCLLYIKMLVHIFKNPLWGECCVKRQGIVSYLI